MKNFLHFLLFSAACFAWQAAAAQGILLDDEAYLAAPFETDTLRKAPPPGGKKSLLENEDPPLIPDQGKSSICAGCAIAMAAAIKHRFYCQRFCACKKQPLAFSRRCIYNQVRDPATGLVSMKRALDLLVSQGICLAADFPDHSTGLPSAAQLQAAATYKIWTYKRIFRLSKEFANHPDSLRLFREQFVQKSIVAIDNSRPVLVGLAITSDFERLTAENCRWSPPDPLGFIGWHALVLVGYDDQAREFTLLNSYGADWGCGGMARISYDDFERVARYGYSLMLVTPFGGDVECGK